MVFLWFSYGKSPFSHLGLQRSPLPRVTSRNVHRGLRAADHDLGGAGRVPWIPEVQDVRTRRDRGNGETLQWLIFFPYMGNVIIPYQVDYNWLVVTGTVLFSADIGNVIIPIDEPIFSRGFETTNQIQW